MGNVHRTTTPHWPFWLLIAAWICANSPQAATYAVLEWLADARHFSHQQQLTRDVAYLLVGEKSPPRALAHIAQDEQSEPAPLQPGVPAEAVLKKIDLSSESRRDVSGPATRASMFAVAPDDFGDRRRGPPPHGPPRAELMT